MAIPTINNDLDKKVLNRLQRSESLLRYHRKVYQLRRLVAGDFSEVIPGLASAQQQGKGDKDQLSLDDFYAFIITDFEEGYCNRMLQVAKQLLMKTSYAEADVEFEDLPPRMAQLHSQYLKQRWSAPPFGCGARDHMRAGLLDFIIGGFGWSYTCNHEDIPSLHHADTLCMNWDRQTAIPTMMRWTSCRYPVNYAQALQIFGNRSKALVNHVGSEHERLNDFLELEYYYDKDSGHHGKMYVTTVVNDGPGEIVEVLDNPNFFEVAGRMVGFNPFTPMYFMALPSTTEPIGAVEMMFPDQLSLWGIEAYKRQARDRGRPFWEIKDGAMKQEERKKWDDGELGATVATQDGNSIAPRNGLEIPKGVYEDQSYHERQLMAHAGMNPYGLGAPPEGISYSSEVKEIAGNSDITSAYIGEDHALWWQITAKKFIAFAAQQDDVPIRIKLDGTPITFDAYNPIKDVLVVESDLVVSAEKMAFRPRGQKIAEAMQVLEVCTGLAKLYPNAVAKAFEEYLRASGKRDVAGWMEPPQLMPGVGGGMAPGAMDTGAAEALASSA